MSLAKGASILTLIGGIIGILVSLIVVIALVLTVMFARGIEGETASTVSVAVTSILGIYFLTTSILVIVASQKMKNPTKRKVWSILAIVFSIVGMGTIFGLIGGILGLVAED